MKMVERVFVSGRNAMFESGLQSVLRLRVLVENDIDEMRKFYREDEIERRGL